MNRINITTCPVCGGTELKQEMTCVDHCATGETFQLWRCAGCGFLFTQDFPADDSMDDYYDAPAYISHTDTWQGIVNTTYHLVRAFMLRRKARLVERAAHLRKGNLLDIGAGTGYFARAMMKRGWQVKAVDTTGAGDTFCGALCVALAERRTLVEAAGFATCASALSVQKYGAQASVPYRSEVERIYAARHDGSEF